MNFITWCCSKAIYIREPKIFEIVDENGTTRAISVKSRSFTIKFLSFVALTLDFLLELLDTSPKTVLSSKDLAQKTMPRDCRIYVSNM